MSVDVRVSAERPIKCPHCGEIVHYITIIDETSGGDIWLKFLENIGYYAPYDEALGDRNWPHYAETMILTDDQVKKLLKFLKNDKVPNNDSVWSVVNHALKNNDKVGVFAIW